jgi:hypothetical protein
VYLGEVSVSQAVLQSFLKTASLLRIRGLAEEAEDEADDLFTKRKRKAGSKAADSAKKLTAAEEIHLRKRKSAAACGSSLDHGGGGLEPSSAKLHCGTGSTFVGGVKNGAADLLAVGGGGDELMLKQEPVDPGGKLSNRLHFYQL